MPIYSHDIYENVRTRVIVIHQGQMLLLEPLRADEGWRLPGGGIEPNESLSECGEREVWEETRIRVQVTSVAFLREWVVPKYCPMDEGDERIGYGIEVHLYAHPLDGDPCVPRREFPEFATPHWIPLEQVKTLPLWPKELKSLAEDILAGHHPQGVPSFVSHLESPDADFPRNVHFA